MGESERQDSLSGDPRSARPRFRLLRPVLYMVGLLLLGAGLCCGVFCGMVYTDAVSVQNNRQNLQRLAVTGAGGLTVDGKAWTKPETDLYLERLHTEELSKLVTANQLLAVSIGLALGGLSLSLLGWGLRPAAAIGLADGTSRG